MLGYDTQENTCAIFFVSRIRELEDSSVSRNSLRLQNVVSYFWEDTNYRELTMNFHELFFEHGRHVRHGSSVQSVYSVGEKSQEGAAKEQSRLES